MIPAEQTCSIIEVVGAGCIGLTTAVRLLQAGYPVLVLADHLPHDSLNPASSSSTAAGAHHLSFADNADWRQRFFDQRTYDILWEESQDAEVAARRGLMRLTQTEFYAGDEKHIRFLEQLPDVSRPTQRPRIRILIKDHFSSRYYHQRTYLNGRITPARLQASPLSPRDT